MERLPPLHRTSDENAWDVVEQAVDSRLDDFDEDCQKLGLAPSTSDLEQAKQDEATLNKIHEDIQDLNESMRTLASVVHTQQEDINVIEQNLTTASDNVEASEKILSKALKYTTATYPIAGATIGCCVAGPLGLMVGLKVGAVATAVGGFIGFHGARILSNAKTAHTQMESTCTTSSNVQNNDIIKGTIS